MVEPCIFHPYAMPDISKLNENVCLDSTEHTYTVISNNIARTEHIHTVTNNTATTTENIHSVINNTIARSEHIYNVSVINNTIAYLYCK